MLSTPPPRRRRATLRDVATRASVSLTTASFVLNDRPNFKIAPETRERVQAAAIALDYRPHHSARSLSRGRSGLLGLVVADLSNPYSWEVAEVMDRVAHAAGFSLVVSDAKRSLSTAQEQIERLLSLDLDGMLITQLANVVDYLDARTRRSMARTSPAVFYGGSPDPHGNNPLPGVYLDGKRTGCVATRHLIERGHRRIAFLFEHLPWALEWDREFRRSRPRLAGYREALEQAGLAYDESLVYAVDQPGAQPDEMLRRHLGAAGAVPSAIVAYNDMAAFGAYRVLHELGRRVPDDVAVVGVDNIRLAEQMYPSLTTVSQRIEEAVDTATRMLLRMIDEPEYAGEMVELEPEVILRRST
jgi:LacI family transcriptional regulator